MRGLKEMLSRLDKIQKELERNQELAAKAEADDIMSESKDVYAPKDRGDLIESGFVNDPVRDGDDVTVTFGYGVGYAVPLHEHPSEHSPPTWEGKELQFTKPGTGPKFLEIPLMQRIDGMPERITERMKLK